MDKLDALEKMLSLVANLMDTKALDAAEATATTLTFAGKVSDLIDEIYLTGMKKASSVGEPTPLFDRGGPVEKLLNGYVSKKETEDLLGEIVDQAKFSAHGSV